MRQSHTHTYSILHTHPNTHTHILLVPEHQHNSYIMPEHDKRLLPKDAFLCCLWARQYMATHVPAMCACMHVCMHVCVCICISLHVDKCSFVQLRCQQAFHNNFNNLFTQTWIGAPWPNLMLILNAPAQDLNHALSRFRSFSNPIQMFLPSASFYLVFRNFTLCWMSNYNL